MPETTLSHAEWRPPTAQERLAYQEAVHTATLWRWAYRGASVIGSIGLATILGILVGVDGAARNQPAGQTTLQVAMVSLTVATLLYLMSLLFTPPLPREPGEYKWPCPKCRQPFRYSVQDAGGRLKCPYCHNVADVPSGSRRRHEY